VRAAVSFYSHRAEAHEAITQVPGSFRRTVESIRELVRAGVPVRVGLIRMSLNQDDTQPAHELLVGLGVPAEAITVDNVRPTGRGCGDSLVPSGGLPLMMSPPSGGEIQVRGNGELGCSTCWSGKVAVAPTGEVFPCIFSRELPVGNALGGSLRTVLENPILQDLWSIDKAQIPVCKDCEFRYGCFDCRALAYKQTGQLRSKPPSCTYDPYSGVWLQAATEPAAELPHETSVPVRPADLRCAVTGEIGVLYSKARQALLRVNRVAAEVCRLCDGRRSLSGIARRLARRYGEPVSRVARDVQALVGELARHGLLEVRAA
jgi:radical SAM protein with 4Fe4S-binding SPASM domain